MLKKNKVYFLLVCLAIIFSYSHCKKDTTDKKLPHAYVNFYMDLNSTQYITLSNIGSYVYVMGGVSGIIIYNEGNGQYMAYDRFCTLMSANCTTLTVTKNGLM